MKSFLTMMLIVYLMVGILYALAGGYYTRSFLYNGGLQHQSDYVENVQHAYLDTENILHVCLRGELITDSAVTEFTYSLPAIVNRGNVESIRARDYIANQHDPGFIIVPRTQIQSGCKNLENSGDQSVDVEELSLAVSSLDHSDRALGRTLRSPTRYILYRITKIVDGEIVGKNKDIVLVGNGPISFNENFSFIRGRMAKVRGSPLWFLAVPFGFAIDAMTFPLQIFAWIGFANLQ